VQGDIWEKTTGCVLQAHPEIEISLGGMNDPNLLRAGHDFPRNLKLLCR